MMSRYYGYNGHAVAYDAVKNKIITFTGGKIRCFELSDFYSGDQSKAEEIEPENLPNVNVSSQGMGAYGGLVFLVYSNKSGGGYSGNTIIVYDVENKKYVTSLETNYTHELEDCMFDSSGNMYVSDTMGNLFKPGVNAYTLGANGSVSNPVPTNGAASLFDIVMEFVAFSCNVLSDALQALCESCENNKTYMNCLKLTHTNSEIEADSNLNSKINYQSTVSGEPQQADTVTLKEMNVPNTIEDKLGNIQTVFSPATPIPTFEVSFDNLVIDTLNILDIDFFTKENAISNSNTTWRAYRNIVSIISHGVIYICAATLIVMLIIRSALIVASTIRGIPVEARNAKKVMDNLLGAIAIIVGVFIIIACCIFLGKLLTNIIIGENRNNFLLRVNVENTYSFNTNFMGYFKYRSLSTNNMDAVKWAVVRLLFTIINTILFFLMIARMLFAGFLTMIAPITAVNYMRSINVQNEENMQSIFYFAPFVRIYASLALIPVIDAMFLLLILKI